MATVYFTASSLDGFIVDEANSLDWLTSRAIDVNGPFSYEAFNTGVGALVSATCGWSAAVTSARSSSRRDWSTS